MIGFDNPLPLRTKYGLSIESVTIGVEKSWIVKDAISLKYFRLREEERLVLSLIDGHRSLKAICRDYEAGLSPQRISEARVIDFISRLHSQGLVTSETSGQGTRLLDADDRQRRVELWRQLRNPLAIRFRGIDPRRLLDRLLPWTRFLFSPSGVIFSLIAFVIALVVVAVRWNTFVDEFANQYDAGISAWLVVAIVLGSVKILHELGHGLCCRAFGGDCHELGLMLLLGVPCLYCNVTDSWRFPNRLRRICVSAAGMYFELILASFATLSWSLSAPGVFHYACLYVMVICSVSTVLFNGNPLMRYDGYFILADLINQPNFGSAARDVFNASLRRVFDGCKGIDRSRLPKSSWLWLNLYHVSSVAYGWTLTFSIVLLLFARAREIHAESIARVFLVASLATTTVGAIRCLIRTRSEQRMRSVPTARRVCASLAITALLMLFVCVPLPRRVWGTLSLSLSDAHTVYAEASGRLAEQVVRPGSSIKSGEVIAKLTDEDLDARVMELSDEHTRLTLRLSYLQAERFVDPAAALSMPQLSEEIKDVFDRLATLTEHRSRLTLRARRDGIVMPGKRSPSEKTAGQTLACWTGRPYDPKNLGCWLERGTQYCTVGDPHRWDASLSVHPDDIAAVIVGQEVQIKFDELPNAIFAGHVAEIMQGEAKEGKDTDSEGWPGIGDSRRTQFTSFEVRVVLNDHEAVLCHGLNGTAKIMVAPESLGGRLVRWCSQTFYLEL